MGLMVREGSGDQVLEALATLTPTQQRRVIARLGGATLQEIANAEGCSTSAIDQSLKSPSVKTAFSILGYDAFVIKRKSGDTFEDVNPILVVLQQLFDVACNASKAVVVSKASGVTHIEKVEDYPTRLAAISKILSLVNIPSPAQPGEKTARSGQGVELEQTETEMRSTRRRVRLP